VRFRREGRGFAPALTLCLVLVVFVPGAGAQTGPTCDGRWRVYASHLGRSGNVLNGAAVMNPHEAWAVGFQQRSNGSVDPLIERWNGTSWELSGIPDLSGPSNVLDDVDESTSSDAWAVGRSLVHGNDVPLLMHWSDTGWTVMRGAAGVQGELFGVDMVASNDVWAVGTQQVGDKVETLAEHWDGASWSVVPSPNPGHHFNYLFGVSANSSSSVVAVGYRQGLYANSTLVEHWDGAAWRVVPIRIGGTLAGVWTARTADAWAAGPPVLREEDDAWTKDPNPEPAATFNGVSGRTTDGGVWAVGTRSNADEPPDHRTAIIRWTGTRWIAAPAPSPGPSVNVLEGVAASEPFVWAVGYTQGRSIGRKALILGVC
jgi:hypothetical protein